MPYKQFDKSRLNILPLSDRIHDVDLKKVYLDPATHVPTFTDPNLPNIAEAIYNARRKHDATVLMMYGAHVIRTGNGGYMIELMKRGLVTHFATNGAGSIHDFELAKIGYTCESVAKYISEGQFGLWTETGEINDIIRQAAKEGIGWGEAIGRHIWENNFPYREQSVLAMGYHLGVPCTVHVGVGNDIIHEHPNCDGAAMGACSYTDFLVYAQSITNLEHGVFLDFGSAVAGPEVYLKALAMARNVAKQDGEKITDFTTAVFDLLAIESSDNYNVTPEKSDPRYYFRPWKTILSRTVADGGKSYYVRGEHNKTVPALSKLVFDLDK